MQRFVYCLNCDCLHLASEVKQQFSTGFRRINGVDYPLSICKTTSPNEALTGQSGGGIRSAIVVSEGKPVATPAIGA